MDADLAAQFRELGVSSTEIGPAPDQDEETFEVWDVNWASLTAFLACETQWRVAAGLAGLIWLGLDYPGVDVVLRRLGLADHVFADLQVMERAALDVFAEAG